MRSGSKIEENFFLACLSQLWISPFGGVLLREMARFNALGENTIYYNAGFKSYKITKCHLGAETWYEWFERSRKLMRSVTVSHKNLKWLVSVFIEASKTQGKEVRRWKTRDHFSELFSTLKYNENGRYISFIALQGQKKSIIITPECYHKGGWSNIAHKIAKFIYTTKEAEQPQTAATSKITRSFKEVCNTNR